MANACIFSNSDLHDLQAIWYNVRMKKIAVMVENSRAFGRGLIEGIASYAQENGSWLLRPVTGRDTLSANLREFDGIIARIADDRLAERIIRSGRPAVDVFCQKSYPGIAGVENDHRQIGILARRFFESRGFQNFAYCGLPGDGFSDSREKAFANRDTFVYSQRSRIPADESQFYDERPDRTRDARALSIWLKSLPKPIAIFCCNDLRAIQLQRVAIDLGLKVPQDISILGVDNDTVACSFAEVPISSINPKSLEIGYAAARILKTIMAKRPEPRQHKMHRIKPGEIIERASTDFMPIDPPWLGQALMHIERNMRRPVSAAEIFALAGRSSTFVENVFKEKLGMPVQTYITSVKMRQAKRMIADRNLRISEIAYLCGFSSPQYFCRTFTSVFGVNPKKFRERKHV